MQVEAGPLGQPLLNSGVLGGGVVIQHQVKVQLRGRLPLNLLQEFQPLAVGVLGGGARQDFTFQVIEGGKERHGAVAVVVVGFGAQGGPGPRATPVGSSCRAWIWVFSSQHKARARSGGSRIEPNHVPEFGFKIRIARKLEDFGQVRLEVISGPESLHGGLL
jgi:hypothetical protein